MKKFFLLLIGLVVINSLWAADPYLDYKYDTLIKNTPQGVQIILEITTEKLLVDYQSTYSLEGQEWLEMYRNEILEKKDSINILCQIFPPQTLAVKIVNFYYPENGTIENKINLIPGNTKYNSWYIIFLFIVPLAFFLGLARLTIKQRWTFLLLIQVLILVIVFITILLNYLYGRGTGTLIGVLTCLAAFLLSWFEDMKKYYGKFGTFLFIFPIPILIGNASNYFYTYGQALGLEPVHWQYLIVLAIFCGIGWLIRIIFKLIAARKRNQQAKEKILAKPKK